MEVSVVKTDASVEVTSDSGQWLRFPIDALRSEVINIDAAEIGGTPKLAAPDAAEFIVRAWMAARTYALQHKLV